MSSNFSRFYDFGPFRIDASQHVLMRDGVEISLTPKAFETLLLLVRNSGRIVDKDELLKTIWPEAYVEEATLAQNVFTIRKALGGSEGDQYIQTIPKRGYRFIVNVTAEQDQSAAIQSNKPETLSGPTGEAAVPARSIYSIAVLPLINQSEDLDVEYLSDGLTETITNSLSLIPELQVKACSTVVRYKKPNIDPQEAGRELGVSAVLVGRLIPVSDNLVIRMELVETTSGWQLWGEEYNRGLSDLPKLQIDITRDISQTLRLKVTDDKWERLSKLQTDNPQAFQLYLKGRGFLNRRTKAGYIKATDCFEQAIELDPGFALAYSGLADTYILYDFYGLVPPWNTIPKARAAAVKAVALGDELAETHTSLGSITLIHDRDLVGAEREFKRAIRLNPKYARAHHGYAHCLLALGRTAESLAASGFAVDLEPFDVELNQHLGWHYLFAREYDHAIDQLEKTLEMAPDFYRARVLLGIAYGQKGSFSQAIEEFLRARMLEQTTMLSGFLGYAYGMGGDEKKALKVLNELIKESKETYVSPYSMTLIYVGLGRRDEALEWVQRACVEYGHWRGWLELTPELDSLRADPRFIKIVRQSSLTGQY